MSLASQGLVFSIYFSLCFNMRIDEIFCVIVGSEMCWNWPSRTHPAGRIFSGTYISYNPPPICLLRRMSFNNNVSLFFTVFASSSAFWEGCLWTVWCSFHYPHRVALRIHSHHRWCVQKFSTKDTGALPCWSLRSCVRSSLVGSQHSILTLDCYIGDIPYEVYKQFCRISVPYPFQWGAPTFDAGEAFAMMMTSFIALVEVCLLYYHWKWKNIPIYYFISIYS